MKPLLTIDELIQTEQRLNLTVYVTDFMYEEFKEMLEVRQMRFV